MSSAVVPSAPLRESQTGVSCFHPVSLFSSFRLPILLVSAACDQVWRIPVPDRNNVNSACDYYCHVGNNQDDHLRPRLSLLARLAREPVFDILRTKEQLGYLVFSSVRTSTGSMGFRILVQSRRSAAFLESRIEAFLESLKRFLRNMSDEDFETTRQGLVSSYAERPKNMQEETSRFWSTVQDGDYDFERRKCLNAFGLSRTNTRHKGAFADTSLNLGLRDIEQIKLISKQEIVDLFMRFIHPTSSTRSKMPIHMDSQASLPASRGCETTAGKNTRQVQQSDEAVASEISAPVGSSDNDVKTIQDDVEAKTRNRNVFIEDIVGWKAGLVCGPATQPVEKLIVAQETN